MNFQQIHIHSYSKYTTSLTRKNYFSDRMRYPPDEWIILPDDRFATHVVRDTEQSLTADVLLQVSRSAQLEGCFKIQLGGTEILHADFPAKGSDLKNQ